MSTALLSSCFAAQAQIFVLLTFPFPSGILIALMVSHEGAPPDGVPAPNFGITQNSLYVLCFSHISIES